MTKQRLCKMACVLTLSCWNIALYGPFQQALCPQLLSVAMPTDTLKYGIKDDGKCKHVLHSDVHKFRLHTTQ